MKKDLMIQAKKTANKLSGLLKNTKDDDLYNSNEAYSDKKGIKGSIAKYDKKISSKKSNDTKNTKLNKTDNTKINKNNKISVTNSKTTKSKTGLKLNIGSESMRLNKFISHNSGYSRREADELIKSGKVSINGRVVSEFVEISGDERIRINGKLLKQKTEFSVIVYHKPKGELVSKRDDRGRKTIYDSLPNGFKSFVSVGRLDFSSEGLLLLTDAPAIADALMNSDIEREYYLKLKGEIGEDVKTAMREGFFANDATRGAHAKSKIKSMQFSPFVAFDIFGSSGGYTKLRVIISEGQNRELRRFFGCFDLEVVELKRVSFGRVELGMLKEGKWRYFQKSEYEDLRDFLKQNSIRW